MRILIDCTDTYHSGLNTGIQRVVRKLVEQSRLVGPELGLTCLPVIFQDDALVVLSGLDDPRYRRAARHWRTWLNKRYLSLSRRLARVMPTDGLRNFLLAQRHEFGLAWLLYLPFRLLDGLRRPRGRANAPAVRQAAAIETADCLLLPDASWTGHSWQALERLRHDGVRLVFLVHDIIPLTHPEYFHPRHVALFGQWFAGVLRTADYLLYNSAATELSVAAWFAQHGQGRCPPGAVAYLGHDFGAGASAELRHRGLQAALSGASAVYLCVGTLEPRKNHALLLDAFELLWAEDAARVLVLIGRAGWLCEALLDRIHAHVERGRRLFWFDDVDDQDLAACYTRATALVFPSRTEGFGLPLVEALALGLPVIASDIPVFREIAGGHARFFPPTDAAALAAAVRQLEQDGGANRNAFRWPDWRQSTIQLLTRLRDQLGPAATGENPPPASASATAG